MTHIDFHAVADRHFAIDRRLIEWARWVRVRPQAWRSQPMWRGYQSMARQWHAPEVSTPINTLQAHEIERAVSLLPEKHRVAIRWAYVFAYIPVSVVRRELGVTKDDLLKLLTDARDMLCNRLREKLVDTAT